MSKEAFEDGIDEYPQKNLKSKSKTPLLDYYGKDLVVLAKNGDIDPVFGRDAELEEIINIINKKKKNNPMLTGAPGVGKTAIVEALALKIINKDCPVWLSKAKLIELNINSLVSGTKYRGEFEQRVEELVREIESMDDLIVFIDEIHNLVGAGSSAGALDAANIIKPALTRGRFKCIGATTSEEYKKVIENEGALARRFQKIHISEPTKEETTDILNHIKQKYEDYHGVIFSEEIIQGIIEISDRYINDRCFPDKAIDLMDEVGAKVKVGGAEIVVPDYIRKMETDREKAEKNKLKASQEQDFEKAASFRDKEKELIVSIEDALSEWENKYFKENKKPVEHEDVAKIISNRTGVPLHKLSDDENQRLLGIGEYIEKRLIGQEEAVGKITEAMQRSRLGIQDPNKPIASMLFLGSTGVGKTYLAKILAEYLFDTSESFIRIDMSEYEEKYSISKLIGSPPGYVGHEDKGQLTEKIKNRPYSLVLFDEIEKAHPDVFNVLLQVLDDGKLTDSTGGEVNFKNTVIIMTSNVGTRNVIENTSLGFGAKDSSLVKNNADLVMKAVEKKFKPEFLNRLDEKIVFNPLGEKEIEEIVKIELDIVLDRIRERGYDITADKSVIKFLCENGFDRKYGARPAKRTITQYISNQISKSVLNKEIKEGDSVKISVNKNQEIQIKKTRKNVKNKKK